MQVKVHRVEDVQGKEFRALIISTVRTSSSEPVSEKEAGFLTNPKVCVHVYLLTILQWYAIFVDVQHGSDTGQTVVGGGRRCSYTLHYWL